MNKLSTAERVRIVSAFMEGNSLRSIVRMTGMHRTTIQKLLVELGVACSNYQSRVFKNLPCKRIQFDEIWNSSLVEFEKSLTDFLARLEYATAMCEWVRLSGNWR